MALPEPTEAVLVQFDCVVCGKKASRIELTPPGAVPPSWASLNAKNLEIMEAQREQSPEKWWVVYSGPEAGSGPSGSSISEDRAQHVLAMLTTTPLTAEIVNQAGFYDDAGFCTQCGGAPATDTSLDPPADQAPPRPYCYDHWNVSSTGYGTCPFGHGKSLDPHWSPE